MIIIKGNLLKTPFQYIAHQVNCIGVMGAGVAKQIKEKERAVYDEYKKILNHKGAKHMLGKSWEVRCGDKRYINIFGQYDCGHDKQQTNYEAFKSAFEHAINNIRLWEVHKDFTLTIAIPYKIGCGLAGGDWNVISEILESIEKEQNVVFVAYDIEGVA